MDDLSALTGAFCTHEDALPYLRVAAETPLPERVRLALAHSFDGQIITRLLFQEDQGTQKGFWRAALAALLAAESRAIDLPDLPDEVRSEIQGLRRAAFDSNKQLYEDESFVVRAAALMVEMEARQRDGSSPENDDDGDVPGLESAKYSPVIKFLAGRAHTSVKFQVSRSDGTQLISEDIPAEDLLFLANSALQAALYCLGSTSSILKDGAAFRYVDDQQLGERVGSIISITKEVATVLGALPVMDKSD